MTSIRSSSYTPPPLINTESVAPEPEVTNLSKKGGAPSPELKARVQDTFTKAGNAMGQGADRFGKAVDTWNDESAKTATDKVLKSGTGVVGPLSSGLGTAASAYGIQSNARSLADSIKKGDSQEITQDSLALAKSTDGFVTGALNTAASADSYMNFRNVHQDVKNQIGEGTYGKDSPVTKGTTQAFAEAFHKGTGVSDVDLKTAIAKNQDGWAGTKQVINQGIADQFKQYGLTKPGEWIENHVAKKGEEVMADAGKAADAGKELAKDGGKAVGTAGNVAKGAEAAGDVAKAAGTALKGAEGVGTAVKVGAEAASTVARAAGRFAPGANVAMAGIDTAIAARNLADPHASIASKVTSSVAAAGSIAAATNVPIVSQVGAAVSTVANVAGLVTDTVMEHKEDIKKGLEVVGDGVKKGAEVVGDGVKKGAEVVGDGVKKGAEVVGEGIKKGAETVGDKIKEGFDKFKNLFH